MSLADDLLEQARHLATRDVGRPRQASLRRAVSAAYYALFHFLVREATGLTGGGDGLRSVIGRAYSHAEMKKACQQFVRPAGLESPLREAVGAVPADLVLVTRTFIDLQEARHDADYNLTERFNRPDTLVRINQVEAAMEAWGRIRATPAARAFLALLLIGNDWKR